METIVVYDSQYGNTERIARAVVDTAQTAGHARLVHIGPDALAEFGRADLLVVGSPTQGWRPTPAMQSFLTAMKADLPAGMAVACFDTRFQKPRWLTGSAARSMSNAFRSAGAVLVAPPESFFVKGSEGPLVDGELDRASAWASTLLAKVTAPRDAMT
jgi:flavodoxin